MGISTRPFTVATGTGDHADGSGRAAGTSLLLALMQLGAINRISRLTYSTTTPSYPPHAAAGTAVGALSPRTTGAVAPLRERPRAIQGVHASRVPSHVAPVKMAWIRGEQLQRATRSCAGAIRSSGPAAAQSRPSMPPGPRRAHAWAVMERTCVEGRPRIVPALIIRIAIAVAVIITVAAIILALFLAVRSALSEPERDPPQLAPGSTVPDGYA